MRSPTLRERRVMELLLQGCDNQEIADSMCITIRTVKAYMHRLFLIHNISGGHKRVKLAVMLYNQQAEKEKADATTV